MTSTPPRHPYAGLPDHQFFSSAPGGEELDPVTDVPFKIAATDRVATAGSCFAQNMALYMNDHGLNHHIVERTHPMIPEEIAARHNYGLQAARYGNIYTPRQLLQLFQRAYGLFEPVETSWPAENDSVVDPFRPQIQPGGFRDETEVLLDRDQHFAAVREMVETLDVFVFTLGLTEAWEDTRDGAIYPVPPGVAGGVYDPATVAFRNFDEVETADDLRAAIAFLRERNPAARIVLTVSPVPLTATYEDSHAWAATTWSKAVLRIVAERVAKETEACCYFPAFEVFMDPRTRGKYFAKQGRIVRQNGVDHVMELFVKHFFEEAPAGAPAERDAAETERADAHRREMETLSRVLCSASAITNT